MWITFIDKSGKKVFSFSEHGILAAWDFSEGLAAAVIEVGGKRGYIDKTGRVVIPCKYDQANDFHDGLARVYIGDKGYFIDKTGRELDITFYSDEVGKQKIIWPPKDEELPF